MMIFFSLGSANMKNQYKDINGNLLLASFKKLLIKKGHKIPSDEACDEWIQRWRQRRGITLKGVHGESKACPDYTAFPNNISPVVAQYNAKSIFNVDETALFYRMQTAKAFAMPGEQVHGGKLGKFTILVAANALGEKLSLLCIGKSKKVLAGR